MLCRHCGTEIADKAIVCYRCGAGTSDPVRKAVPIKRQRSLLGLVVAVLMLLLALYFGYASQTATDPKGWQLAAGVLVGAALGIFIIRLVRRR